jgi:hypothetical protein
VVLGATAASAQAPEKEVIQVDETFADDFLTEECGVPVTTTATGRVTLFDSPDGVVLLHLTTLNISLVATAGDNQARFRDVGADQLRMQPDGTLILSIIGQVPFEFTGVLKINPETGEVILEPHHEVDTTRVCERLTA